MLDSALVLFGSMVILPPALVFLPLPDAASLPFLAVSVAIHVVYFILVALAYQHGELTVVYPLMRGAAPAVTTLLAVIFFNELPPGMAWMGILFVSAGILSLALGGCALHGRRGITFALANAGVIVIYTLVDGQGARLSGNALAYTGWMMLLTALCVVGWILQRNGTQATRHWRRNWMKGLVGGCCTVGSYSLALWAMTLAPIGLVAALRETSIVFGTLLGIGVLKERPTRKRLLAILVVAVGAVLIKIS